MKIWFEIALNDKLEHAISSRMLQCSVSLGLSGPSCLELNKMHMFNFCYDVIKRSLKFWSLFFYWTMIAFFVLYRSVLVDKRK